MMTPEKTKFDDKAVPLYSIDEINEFIRQDDIKENALNEYFERKKTIRGLTKKNNKAMETNTFGKSLDMISTDSDEKKSANNHTEFGRPKKKKPINRKKHPIDPNYKVTFTDRGKPIKMQGINMDEEGHSMVVTP